MLLAVLLGIALGAFVYERVRTRAGRPEALIGPLFLAAGLVSLATMAILGRLPEAFLQAMRHLPVRFEAHALMRPAPLPRHPAARDHAPRHHVPAAAASGRRRRGAGPHGAPLRLEHGGSPRRGPGNGHGPARGLRPCRDRASSSPAFCSPRGRPRSSPSEMPAAPSGPGRGRAIVAALAVFGPAFPAVGPRGHDRGGLRVRPRVEGPAGLPPGRPARGALAPLL